MYRAQRVVRRRLQRPTRHAVPGCAEPDQVHRRDAVIDDILALAFFTEPIACRDAHALVADRSTVVAVHAERIPLAGVDPGRAAVDDQEDDVGWTLGVGRAR